MLMDQEATTIKEEEEIVSNGTEVVDTFNEILWIQLQTLKICQNKTMK